MTLDIGHFYFLGLYNVCLKPSRKDLKMLQLFKVFSTEKNIYF